LSDTGTTDRPASGDRARVDAGPRDLAALKQRIGSGLLSFPVTYFTADGTFDPAPYQRSVARAASFRPAALFAAGGTGEFFSLDADEYPDVVRAAVAGAAGSGVPILAGAGYGTRMAIRLAQAAERAGAAGVLLFPPYLIVAEQAGLFAHVKAVCDAVGIGVVVYNRDNAVIRPDTLKRLADACPNLIGFKDGHGNIEMVWKTTTLLGDRLTYIGGMPTAEVFAVPYAAAGVTTYSSAVFNFIPRAALGFYQALQSGDRAFAEQLLKRFFYPYLAIRDRGRGYAVSIVKAGMRVMGEDPGPVRSPLTDLSAEEHKMLEALLKEAFDGHPA
jgi:5-dehydro-4-deoxyglucarate dehydratase